VGDMQEMAKYLSVYFSFISGSDAKAGSRLIFNTIAHANMFCTSKITPAHKQSPQMGYR